MDNAHVLIIDDEPKIRQLMSRIITLEGFTVLEAADVKSALKKVRAEDIDIVLSDVKLPDGNGLDLLQAIKAINPVVEVILLTAYGNIPDSVYAIKNGAFDYVTKGDENNKILPLLHKASEKVALAKRVQQLERRLDNKYHLDGIIGKSKTLKLAIAAAQKVAATDATVLLNGETGTGKEVFAQAIHQASTRSRMNFVAVNCSAFSKELLENELFGHKQGAFTGASKDTKGIFEEANKGTVFLDEIGEMPLDLQAKLLRVLETGEFLKVGDSKPTKVDVRIIAATNRDLQQEIAAGHFREDLFYRIAVFQIALPSLRERIDDLAELAHFFLKKFNVKTDKKIKEIAPEYIDALKRHHWKGNIRELRNVIERSVILADGNTLEVDSLPLELQSNKNDVMPKAASALTLAEAEKCHIQKVLHHTNGNKAEAARLLEIGIATLYRKIDEYKM